MSESRWKMPGSRTSFPPPITTFLNVLQGLMARIYYESRQAIKPVIWTVFADGLFVSGHPVSSGGIPGTRSHFLRNGSCPGIRSSPTGESAFDRTRGRVLLFFSDYHEYQHLQNHRRRRYRRPADPPSPRLLLRLLLGHHLFQVQDDQDRHPPVRPLPRGLPPEQEPDRGQRRRQEAPRQPARRRSSSPATRSWPTSRSRRPRAAGPARRPTASTGPSSRPPTPRSRASRR